MSYTCANCGHVGSTARKLSDWEIAELRRKASRVMDEYPPIPWRGERQMRLRGVADEYGINLRTLYRHLKAA